MVNKNSMKLFGDDKIRAIWDDEQEKWYFSCKKGGAFPCQCVYFLCFRCLLRRK